MRLVGYQSEGHVNCCTEQLTILQVNFFFFWGGEVYFRSQILERPSIGEYWNISGEPVLPENVIFTSFRHAGVIQKFTILERKNGLVLSNTRVPVSGLEVYFFLFFFFFFDFFFYLGVHSRVITCSLMKPRARMYRTVLTEGVGFHCSYVPSVT